MPAGPAVRGGAALIVAIAAFVITGAPASPAVRPPSRSGASASPAPATGVRELFRLRDDRIDEASGLARGLASPGVLYVQNDSGDSSRFFALDAATGATVATLDVPDAANHDWEDLAVAQDARGRASVWLADTGDNSADRDEVQVYGVDEPRLDAAARGLRVVTGRPDVWRLRYPDGPRDVESLAVAPGGAAYLVAKSPLGASRVYRLPAAPDAGRVQTATPVADLALTFTGTRGGPNAFGQLTATGAAFSRDGSVFALRTYTDAYVWPVAGGDLAAALRVAPVRVALPSQPQGEGVAVDGDRVLLDSEGVGTAVLAIDLPGLPTAPSAAASSPGTAGSSSTGAPPQQVPSQPVATGHRGRTIALPGVVLGLLVALGVVAVLGRRRRAR